MIDKPKSHLLKDIRLMNNKLNQLLDHKMMSEVLVLFYMKFLQNSKFFLQKKFNLYNFSDKFGKILKLKIF